LDLHKKDPRFLLFFLNLRIPHITLSRKSFDLWKTTWVGG
jgi:hypothetical protein